MKARITSLAKRRPVQIGTLVVVAAAVAVGVWLLLGDDDEGTTQFEGGRPTSATPADLRAVSRELGHDVYWIGPRRATTYELTQTDEGNVYVRYLPKGVQIADRRPIFLTVGTYPYRRPLRRLRSDARREGAIVRDVRGGGVAVAQASKPESVYLAYPRSDLMVEVFDSSAARARRLASSGRVVPVR